MPALLNSPCPAPLRHTPARLQPQAGRAHDTMALRVKGPTCDLNFPLSDYAALLPLLALRPQARRGGAGRGGAVSLASWNLQLGAEIHHMHALHRAAEGQEEAVGHSRRPPQCSDC